MQMERPVLKMGLCELPDELIAIHVAGGDAVLRRHKAQCGSQLPSSYTSSCYTDYRKRAPTSVFLPSRVTVSSPVM